MYITLDKTVCKNMLHVVMSHAHMHKYKHFRYHRLLLSLIFWKCHTANNQELHLIQVQQATVPGEM